MSIDEFDWIASTRKIDDQGSGVEAKISRRSGFRLLLR